MHIPYIFLNTETDICKLRKTSSEGELETFNKMLVHEELKKELNLQRDFVSLYINLLNCISESDYKKIGKICEKNLYREFRQSLLNIQPQIKAIELMNLPEDYKFDKKVENKDDEVEKGEKDYNDDSDSDSETFKIEDDTDLIKVEIIDYLTTFGAYIERDTNFKVGLSQTLKSFSKRRPNYKTYAAN